MRVQIESPFFVKDNKQETRNNIKYARECMYECLKRGYSPFASHLLYTQCLDDNFIEDRELGINAGLEFLEVVDFSLVYIDRGISEGMKLGIEEANKKGIPVYYKLLGDDYIYKECSFIKNEKTQLELFDNKYTTSRIISFSIYHKIKKDQPLFLSGAININDLD